MRRLKKLKVPFLCALFTLVFVSCESGVTDSTNVQSIANTILNTQIVHNVTEQMQNDYAAPSSVEVLETSSASDSAVFIEWLNPNDSDFYGTLITSDSSDGNYDFPIFVVGNPEEKSSLSIKELANGSEYEFKLYSVDQFLNVEEEGVSVILKPDYVSYKGEISPVTITTVENANAVVSLEWTLPEEELLFIEISGEPNEDSFENSITLGPDETSIDIAGLTVGKSYRITVTTYNKAMQTASVYTYATPLSKDTEAPSDVSVKAESKEDYLLLTWTDGTEEDLKGYNVYFNDIVTFVEKSSESSRANSFALEDVENNSSYVIKVTALDVNGNESEGVTLNVTVSFTSTSALSLSTTVGQLNEEDKTVPVYIEVETINDNVTLSQLAYKSGYIKSATKLLSDSNAIDITGSKTFTAYQNGTYSVAAKDTYGNVTIKYISVSSIDKTAPDNPCVLSVIAGDGCALLSWENPQVADFNYVKVELYNGTDFEEISRVEGESKQNGLYFVTGLTNGETYTFKLCSVDFSGNISDGVKIVSLEPQEISYSVYNSEEVSSLEASEEEQRVKASWSLADDTSFSAVYVKLLGKDFSITKTLPASASSYVFPKLESGEYTLTVQTLSSSLTLSKGQSESVVIE